MAKYVALLRGMNVGGNKTVSMSKLKTAFEGLGHTNVSTYINSGNVIFETPATDAKSITAAIERALHKALGFEMRVVVRDSATIKKICKAIPLTWQNNTLQKTDILFLWDQYAKKSTIDLIDTTPEIDQLKYTQGSIIWNVRRKHYTKSGMRKFIGTTVYKHMTARNVNTVRKLGELMR